MKFNQVFERCKEKGIKITKHGLYLAGLKNGFIEKSSEHGNIFHGEKFEKWVEKKLEKIPKGYFSLNQCSKELNTPLSTIYTIVNEGKLEVLNIGTKGVKYVKVKELKEYIRIRKHGSEKEYGN